MSGLSKIIAVCVVTASLAGEPVKAATLATFVDIVADANGVQTNIGQFNDNESITEGGDTLDPLAFSVAASAIGNIASGSSDAAGSVDPVTGELKLDMAASGGGTALGQVLLSETFSLSGAGTLNALMSVDVAWASSSFNFSAQVLSPFADNSGGTLIVETASSPSAGSISDQLLVSSFVNGDFTQNVTFTWLLQGAVSDGFVDASNTGRIFFTTDGDLTATPLTAGFLSNPAFPDPMTPIPLPASVWLLALALTGLGALRNRKAQCGI